MNPIASNPVESSPVLSASYVCSPQDSRCRYWAKVIRAEDSIPLPEHVNGADNVPGPYIRKGDEIELFEGDWLLEGEEVSHRRQRGWTYTLHALAIRAKDGELSVCTIAFGSDTKPVIRAAGAKDLLKGSGDIAAMVREIWARRRGYKHMPRVVTEPASDVVECAPANEEPCPLTVRSGSSHPVAAPAPEGAQ